MSIAARVRRSVSLQRGPKLAAPDVARKVGAEVGNVKNNRPEPMERVALL
jgi:hypothetical protein